MPKNSQQHATLKTFRLEKTTLADLQNFLVRHPEVGSLNHLVQVALDEFLRLHEKSLSWLQEGRFLAQKSEA